MDMNTPCCIYNRIFSPAACIYPKNGVWTLENMYEIMLDCENDDDLKGVKPLNISQGGFQWDGTPYSKQLWHDNTYERRRPIEECTMTRQVRTFHVDSSWINSEDLTNWKETFPARNDFKKPMHISKHFLLNRYERQFICLKCKGNPSFGMFLKLVMLFHKHGHTIISTDGFKIDFISGNVVKYKYKRYVLASDIKLMV